MMKQSKKFKKIKGFTLVEVVVAMGLVALLLTGVMGLMGVSAARIDRTVSKSEAELMMSAVEEKLNNVDFADAAGFIEGTAFDESVYVYSYFGALNLAPNTVDGSPQAVAPSAGDLLGVDYQQFTTCRVRGYTDDSAPLTSELTQTTLASSVYLVRFRPMYMVSSALTLQDYGDPAVTGVLTDTTHFTCQVELYKMRSGNPTFILDTTLNDINNPDLYQNARGSVRPVFTTNITIRR